MSDDQEDRIENLEANVSRLEGQVSDLQEDLDTTRDELHEARDLAQERKTQLEEAEQKIRELRQPKVPQGTDELRALAATIRTAQRTGHPDASKHMEDLLRKLGV